MKCMKFSCIRMKNILCTKVLTLLRTAKEITKDKPKFKLPPYSLPKIWTVFKNICAFKSWGIHYTQSWLMEDDQKDLIRCANTQKVMKWIGSIDFVEEYDHKTN